MRELRWQNHQHGREKKGKTPREVLIEREEQAFADRERTSNDQSLRKKQNAHPKRPLDAEVFVSE